MYSGVCYIYLDLLLNASSYCNKIYISNLLQSLDIVWRAGKESSTCSFSEKMARKLPAYVIEILLKMA